MPQRSYLRQTRRSLLRALGVTAVGGVGLGSAGTGGEATFEVLSTDTNADFSYRFQVVGDAEKTTADGNSADEDDVITDNGDGTVTVSGSTGDGHGDVFTVRGSRISYFRKTGGASDYRLELDDTDVTGRMPVEIDGRSPSGDTLEILSTDPEGEFTYRFSVTGEVYGTTADGNAADDADEVIDRQGTRIEVHGSTGDGEGDAFTIQGRLLSFEHTGGSRAYRVELNDRVIESGSGGGFGSSNGDTSTFEILSTDTNADLSYRFRVAGDVEKATADDNSADEDDVITDNGDGTVTVTGSTGDGHGDVFTIYGDVQWFTKTGGASGYRLELDDTDVTGQL